MMTRRMFKAIIPWLALALVLPLVTATLLIAEPVEGA